jgi:hypothetical protein
MDFDKKLPKVTGYIVYATLLDYLDTFVYQHTQQNEGQYPSLRMTTDMVLNLFADIKAAEIPDFENCETMGDALYEFEDHLLKVSKKTADEMFDSRKAGLFTDEGPRFVRMREDEPLEELKPFTLSSKSDKDWLRKCGISTGDKHD